MFSFHKRGQGLNNLLQVTDGKGRGRAQVPEPACSSLTNYCQRQKQKRGRESTASLIDGSLVTFCSLSTALCPALQFIHPSVPPFLHPSYLHPHMQPPIQPADAQPAPDCFLIAMLPHSMCLVCGQCSLTRVPGSWRRHPHGSS